jgi:hypothetical protein
MSGVIATLTFLGSSDTLTFLFYVTEVLLPQLWAGAVVIAAITAAFNAVSASDILGWFAECDARTVLI